MYTIFGATKPSVLLLFALGRKEVDKVDRSVWSVGRSAGRSVGVCVRASCVRVRACVPG